MTKFYFSIIAIFFLTTGNAQIINVPDANFKARLLASSPFDNIAYNQQNSNFAIDANGNGEIEQSEADLVYILNANSYGYAVADKIADLTGIQHFTNLRHLDCALNALTHLDLSGLSNLEVMYATNNQIASVNLTGLSNLTDLHVDLNNLGSLEIPDSPLLTTLFCSTNHIPALDLSGCPQLISLGCSDNELDALDLTGLNDLDYVNCGKNNLTTLNVNHLHVLTGLKCNDNQLQSLFLKNGSDMDLGEIVFDNNPNLEFICVDEIETAQIQNLATSWIGSGCTVNSYCSFSPGGDIYGINGTIKYDSDNNGCSAADGSFPNLKLLVTNGSVSGSVVCDPSGNYVLPVSAGTHNVVPSIENPSYFIISPTNISVSFPFTVSPAIRNFCIAPNGIHRDLEVTILPLTLARPGFNATYKILLKNKGTVTQSGTLFLDFDDAEVDFVSSGSLIPAQSTNSLSWDYIDLQSLETFEINLVLNLNSPIETPALNSGSVLNFVAHADGVAEETQIDNSFGLHQIAVNSLDPNDKTCLEGNTITPEMIGKEIHYMIRFENTGTANAENIVVKDMIDITKFDINSLIPIDGSAPFSTRINGNKVEFIFENINLPFAAGGNDGYVAFKIKTKPTLVLGNTFSNTASIYFDYNFPIITNTTTTTIAALAAQDFKFESYFKIYPNPADTVLNIDSKKQINVTSISIYNTLGQLVLVVPNAQKVATVNVSVLKAGNYFIKVISDKGTSNAQFIKQ